MEKSLASFNGNVILLADCGKGSDFSVLTPLLRTHVEHLILLEPLADESFAAERDQHQFRRPRPHCRGTQAARHAAPGDVCCRRAARASMSLPTMLTAWPPLQGVGRSSAMKMLPPLASLRRRVAMPPLNRPFWLLIAARALPDSASSWSSMPATYAQDRYGDPFIFLRKHLFALGAGLCVCSFPGST